MAAKFYGINVAMATPMSPDGSEIDVPRLRSHVDWLISKGVHGIVPCGSTGEFQVLTDEERATVVEVTIEQAAGRVPVIVHAAAQSTTETLSWARHAHEHGASGLMIVPPWYAPPTEEETYQHYKAISDAVPLDIMLYNIPAHSGFLFTPEFTARIADLEHCRYMKDSSGDFRGLQSLMMTVGDRVTIFNGIDDLAFQAFASGTPGTVWGAVNVMPAECVKLFELVYEQKDIRAGWDLWKRMWPVGKWLESHSYAAAVKEAMDIQGNSIGGPRRPSLRLSAEERAELTERLKLLEPVAV